MSEKTFQVTIMRKECRDHTFTVQAEDRKQAEYLAMEKSNDFDWNNASDTYQADEQIVATKEG